MKRTYSVINTILYAYIYIYYRGIHESNIIRYNVVYVGVGIILCTYSIVFVCFRGVDKFNFEKSGRITTYLSFHALNKDYDSNAYLQ